MMRKNRHPDIILTIFAVSVDCIASGGFLFRAIFTQVPYNILEIHYSWCTYDVLVNNLFITYSGHVLSILSIQRMLLIVFNIRVNIIFWIVIAVALCLFSWIQALIQSIKGYAGLSMLKIFCFIKSSSPPSKPFYYTLLVTTVLTYSTTIISYLTIIVFSVKQCLKQLELNLDKTKVYRECRTIILKSLFFLLPYMTIYFGRMFCWFYELSTGKPRTWNMEYISMALYSSSIIVNCSTVLYMNKEVNKEFINLVINLKRAVYTNN
ncbi:hypothetical protein CONCODRAFT_7317 [Conidiobolus coronatus NRRL 28638]|uniref:G-protein coupled receptors family 1 profile domain-containing protein n=1 Tax=Conidiobolus coronatus (strain ATCC 28846 / CBS 209.66 / NRRL 28638) TaxID=796925 RepID=A0A137P5G7_CONC2|nr:hypothetical protein CONCODRAFT_7317 [Conidiobolus coronatus NRRL 28638]|eukprot:KXN70174.1 hypothetical protein CONCODRAFT_7317 [Conidiobolus coronatus NRRL 28638]